MTPLMCTQNSLFHVDYGIPLLASASTDYRTSTAKHHALLPNIPQQFDCRVKARIKPELLEKDIALRNAYDSAYITDYDEKHVADKVKHNELAVDNTKVHYIRSTQEKIFMNPPPPRPPKISEMKDSYAFHYWRPHRDKRVNVTCEMPQTYRPIQPDIDAAQKGFYRLLDIYTPESSSQYVPYTPEQFAKAQEDFITIYNAAGEHKGLKDELPRKLHGYKNMYDKSVFRLEYPNRILSTAPKKVPHSGMISEHRSNYTNPACSDFYPYLQENGLYFPESLSGSGPWQDLCPPSMYCTENCHIGTGRPVRAVVDIQRTVGSTMVHSQPCCGKI